MDRLRKTLILIFVAAIPAMAPPLLAPTSNLCFTAGSVTYQLAPGAASPDYRVRIDNGAAHPDLRVRLVDRADIADFALVDDAATAAANACRSAGARKTVAIVADATSADVTISLSPAAEADFSLYVHSARVGHEGAAALFALMRHAQSADRAEVRRPPLHLP